MTDFSKYVFGIDDDDRVAVYYKPTGDYVASFFHQEDTGTTVADLLGTIRYWEDRNDTDDTRWEDPRDTFGGLTDNLPTPLTIRLAQFLAASSGRFRDKFSGQVVEYWSCDHDTHVVSLKIVGQDDFIDIPVGDFFSEWEPTN